MVLVQLSIPVEINILLDPAQAVFCFHSVLLEDLRIGKVMHYCTTSLLMYLSGRHDI